MTAGLDEGEAGRISFGPAETSDIDALVSIDRLSHQRWTRKEFEGELANNPKTLFVLRSSGQVVAFVVTRTHPPEMDIVNLTVAPERRGLGIGQLLLRALLHRASLEGVRRAYLEVRESNLPARKLYQKAGFRETQTRPRFYRGPVEDAILMDLKIEQ